jgi:SAM-dependent methyltransferase
MAEPRSPSEFDAYAERYEEALNRGISVSGESKEYFARGRVAWLAERLKQAGAGAGRVLDFGCGTGTATPFLLELFGATSVVGVDLSEASVAQAAKEHADPRARFQALRDFKPAADFDIVYCNGVFHHIPLAERASAMACVRDALKPGGYFGFWENNPWNLGTQIVMSRIPFDRDAIKVSPPEARRLVKAAGMEVVRTDFLFVFPAALKFLRGLERSLAAWPLGAQYQVLARKPLT